MTMFQTTTVLIVNKHIRNKEKQTATLQQTYFLYDDTKITTTITTFTKMEEKQT